MSSVDTIVEINITLTSAAVALESFSIPLIIGPTNASWMDYVHSYTDPAGMLTDGFTTSAPEYVYALEMFEQAITPTEFLVGHRTAAVAQVDTITVNTATASHDYTGIIAGQSWSYTAGSSPTTSTVATGIAAAISALSGANVTAVAVSAVVTVTSSVAGLGFVDTSTDANITIANTTPNNGIQNDLNNIIGENNLWYGMVGCEFADADIEQAASLIESLKKTFIAVSDTSSIPTSSSTDVASILMGKSYKRTGLIYTATANVNEGKDAAWVGLNLPATAGSNNWAFNTLVGCTPDSLTDNQIAILIGNPVAGTKGKNVNIYNTWGGSPTTRMGTMAGGQYIDITIGLDWLESTIQSNIVAALKSQKIPYTDKGTGILISAVKQAIDLGVTNGLIDGASPISISAPSVLSVPASQRANRIAPTISFSCRLTGAINAVIVNGTVSV